MAGEAKFLRVRQVWGWLVLCVFVAGFFWGPVGVWTGAILAAWFVGTQPVRRGFLWMMPLTLLPMLVGHFGGLPLREPLAALEALGWMVAAVAAMVAPFIVHRAVSVQLPGLFKTLPLPAAGAAMHAAALVWMPAGFLAFYAPRNAPSGLAATISAGFGTSTVTFVVLWFAAVVVWTWQQEFRGLRFAKGALGVAAIVVGLAAEARRWGPMAGGRGGTAALWVDVCGLLLLIMWAVAVALRRRPNWSSRGETIALLRSPASGDSLRFDATPDVEALVSEARERFPIREDVPDFRTAEDLSGANGKYNHLYETIGGFYDDTQRVWCALSGMDRNAYVRSYLGRLEVKPGDKVLETSVGTGLNFKYLPRGIRRYGLDLAWDMLVNCQANFRRWGMEGELFLGNAERLPFADESFDVVFHTGGINFFSDRAKAIREMIRVAKPGSLILIADETEEHVKGTFENIPYTREFYKGRDAAVTAPVELVPAEMEEVRAESVWKGRFYALTFRKPRERDTSGAGAVLAESAAT
jgi:ubiquinone/menaquinone biosynthesis C-methylase UbiE